jgi:hypothetical protein
MYSVSSAIGGQYLSVRDSKLGIYPNQDPVIVSSLPSATNPDRVSLHTLSILGVDRAIALVGTSGVLDIFEIDLPSVNTHDRSWEDFVIKKVGDDEVLTWAAARKDRAKPWLAMPEGQGRSGYAVWYIDDFEGGFGGITMPIDNIVLERFSAT